MIRAAQAGDLDALVDASIAVGQESEGLSPQREQVRASIEAALADPRKARYFVADEDGVVGSLFVTFEWSDWNNGWYWWIQGVYVAPSHRRQGVYRRLVEAVRQAARREGDVRAVRLYVDADNAAGTAAHEAVGFRPTSYRIMSL